MRFVGLIQCVIYYKTNIANLAFHLAIFLHRFRRALHIAGIVQEISAVFGRHDILTQSVIPLSTGIHLFFCKLFVPTPYVIRGEPPDGETRDSCERIARVKKSGTRIARKSAANKSILRACMIPDDCMFRVLLSVKSFCFMNSMHRAGSLSQYVGQLIWFAIRLLLHCKHQN